MEKTKSIEVINFEDLPKEQKEKLKVELYQTKVSSYIRRLTTEGALYLCELFEFKDDPERHLELKRAREIHFLIPYSDITANETFFMEYRDNLSIFLFIGPEFETEISSQLLIRWINKIIITEYE